MATPAQIYGNYRGKLSKLWKESPMYHEANARAFVRTGVRRCEKCSAEIHYKLAETDHIEPKMAPGQDPMNIALFAARLNCPATGLQVLCEACHRAKTGRENSKRTKQGGKE